MSFLFGRRKLSPLDRRLHRIRSEMRQLRGMMRSAARDIQSATTDTGYQRSPSWRHGANAAPPGKAQGDLFESASHAGDAAGHEWKGFDKSNDRFVTYLATGSFQSGHTLREERRIQRNKAILMVTFVFLVLAALIYRLLFW